MSRTCCGQASTSSSTVNIQHLESLYNFVEESTGVRVKERVCPDEVLAKADQIVNIDLPAEDLQERLQAGKIYPKERIEAALANFFTQKNLTRLREMTLTETANFLDRQQRDLAESGQNCQFARPGQYGGHQQPGGPIPGRMLRKTARLASQLNAQWYAVYVRTPAESAVRIDAAAQRRVTDTLETAQKMGGLVFSMKGESVAQALVSFAREYGITHIVVGRPGRKRLRHYFRLYAARGAIAGIAGSGFVRGVKRAGGVLSSTVRLLGMIRGSLYRLGTSALAQSFRAYS